MAKMKHFGKALSVVRAAPKTKERRLKSKALAGSVGRMLGAVRAKKFSIADEIARGIIKQHG